MERINKVGVELEGGFLMETYKAAYSKRIWHNDSSVGTTKESGEIVSPACDNLETLCEFIRKWYPVEVNKTCGFHIHISLKSNLDYSRLMSKNFHRYFNKKWHQWGERCNIRNKQFWERLDCTSEEAKQYCKKSFEDPFKQAFPTGREPRYHQLNFCWQKHGTMENRMLPMFQDVELSIKALLYYIEFVEKWLSMQKREFGFSDAVLVDPEETGREKEVIEDEPLNVRERLCV